MEVQLFIIYICDCGNRKSIYIFIPIIFQVLAYILFVYKIPLL